MRELARLGAGLVALLLVLRDTAVAGSSPAMLTANVITVILVVTALTLWRDGLITASALVLAAHYVLSLGYGDVTVDLAAPFVGALLLLYLDLADLAASLPRDRRVDRAFLLVSLRRSLALLVVATAAGTAAFAVAALPLPGLEWVRALGALGVAAVVLVPLLLLRRS